MAMLLGLDAVCRLKVENKELLELGRQSGVGACGCMHYLVALL